MSEQKMPNCKACSKPIDQATLSYLVSQQGDRVCKNCGDAIMQQENSKNPNKIKVVDLEGGEKALVLNQA